MKKASSKQNYTLCIPRRNNEIKYFFLKHNYVPMNVTKYKFVDIRSKQKVVRLKILNCVEVH